MDDKTTLATIIKNNPGATAIIDNDSWYLEAKQPPDYDEWDKEQKYYWDEHKATLARSYDYPELGVSFGYGLLEVMALICDINIETL